MTTHEAQVRSAAATVLRKVLRFVAELSEDELSALIDGRAALQMSDSSRKGAKSKRKTEKIPRDFDHIRSSLSALSLRGDGEALMDELGLNKRELQALASKLDLPVMRNDSVERLRDKIIEATIGYRLRSRAILGHNRVAETPTTESDRLV